MAAIAAKAINAEFQTAPSCGGKKCGKIGRISAMDPAQPMYENSPNQVHLGWFQIKSIPNFDLEFPGLT